MLKSKYIKVGLPAVALTLLFTQVVFGWPWNTDMYWHRSVRTFERPPIAPVEKTMSISQEPAMTREEARERLTNPTPPTPESLGRGKALYNNLCYPCHGVKGHGDGPVAKKFVTPANLSLPMYVEMSDGYIYGTIRNGGVNMPGQGTALYPSERWDVVNYVRSLQKR